MHDTALITGEAFFEVYGREGDEVLDVGSMDVNGTLRGFCPRGGNYVGLDLAKGPGVDIVLEESGGRFPFNPGWFDLVISTSCLEHDPVFWVTFSEMCRVVKPGGFVYVSVPGNGPYHGYPGDCWRFYKDSADALCQWARRQVLDMEVIENFQVNPIRDVWIDQVMVFMKNPPLREVRGSIRALLVGEGTAAGSKRQTEGQAPPAIYARVE